MSLNIKNTEVVELAKDAAALLQTTQTDAVRRGLELLLEENGSSAEKIRYEKRKKRITEAIEQFRRENPWLKDAKPEDLSTDFLYDENGLFA